jgi:hypothetical protein
MLEMKNNYLNFHSLFIMGSIHIKKKKEKIIHQERGQKYKQEILAIFKDPLSVVKLFQIVSECVW